MLTASLEMAQNNIEAYQGSLQGSQQANNVLQLTVDELKHYNDDLVQQVDSMRKKLNIKSKSIKTAATQTQSLIVNASKGVRGDLIETIKDSIYSDTIKYNNLTTAYYTISKDTVNIKLDIRNSQYLFVYTTREYLNKKNWFKRLFTWDWKKVNKNKYIIENTNDLIQTDSVKVIEVH